MNILSAVSKISSQNEVMKNYSFYSWVKKSRSLVSPCQ